MPPAGKFIANVRIDERWALRVLSQAALMNSPRLAYSFTALLLCAAIAFAQEAQLQQARQFDPLAARVQSIAPASQAPTAPASAGDDPDSFGVQQLLRDNERQKLLRTFAEISAFVTDNVALSRTDLRTDSFLLATFGLDYRRPLPRGFQLDAGARVALFRYSEFHQMSFNSIDAGIGLGYHTAKLGGLDLFARYNYTALIGHESQETFLQEHTLSLGAQKTVAFSQAHYAFAGVAGVLGFADPSATERSALSAFAGYHLQATRHLEANLLYNYSYYLYSENSRRDHNQTLMLGARYRFNEWVSVFANSYITWNDSNEEVFDYRAASAGGGLTVSLQF